MGKGGHRGKEKNWLGKRNIGEGEGEVEGEGENVKYKMGSVGVWSGTKISGSAGGIKGGEVEMRGDGGTRRKKKMRVWQRR